MILSGWANSTKAATMPGGIKRSNMAKYKKGQSVELGRVVRRGAQGCSLHYRISVASG